MSSTNTTNDKTTKVDFRSKKVTKLLNTTPTGEFICPSCNDSELMINHFNGTVLCLGGCNESDIVKSINKPKLKEKIPENHPDNLGDVLSLLLDTYRKDIRYNVLLNQYEIFNRDSLSKGYLSFIPVNLDRFVITVAIELGFTLSDNWATKAIQYIGDYNLYNPITSYLDKLEGYSVTDWMIIKDLLGIEDPFYVDLIGGWLYGCIMRAYNPGCKNDLVLILQGKQGIGKSSFFRIMGGDWFTDQFNDYNSKDDRMNVIRHWIIEWAELSVFHSTKQSIIDSFVTSCIDTLRKPYGRELVDYKRIAVFGGTTNEATFFDNTREHRRYGVIPVTNIDLKGLKENRDKIWGSVLKNYLTNNNLYLKVTDLIHNKGKAYEIEDPWVDSLKTTLEDFSQITVYECCLLLNIPSQQQTTATSRRIGAILKSLGFSKKHTEKGNIWIRGDKA